MLLIVVSPRTHLRIRKVGRTSLLRGQEVREQSSLVHTPVSPTRLPCITPLALTSLSSPPLPLHLFPITWEYFSL